MAKFGWRDGKLWAKDIKIDNAPEFEEIDGTDIVVIVDGEKRKISTSTLDQVIKMAKFGWRDGKLWAKDLRLKNAPEFVEVDDKDVVVVVGGQRRKIVTSDYS